MTSGCASTSLVPRIGGPRLAVRIAPHLVDVSAEARRIVARRPSDPLLLFGQLAAPVLTALRDALDRALGGRDTIAWRLRAAGSGLTVERYRSQQLLALLAGAAAGAIPATILADASPALRFALPLLGTAAGLLARDYALNRASRRRLQRMREELPTVLEFLVLSLSAGEGIQDAIRRVARIGSGAVAKELAGVMAEVGSGVPLPTALGRLSRELRLPPLTRAIDHLIAALERGSPLADVLRAQAEDCRNESRRELLESAGRKEIAMLVPLVFLILPTTVVIAIFPGLLVLQTGF